MADENAPLDTLAPLRLIADQDLDPLMEDILHPSARTWFLSETTNAHVQALGLGEQILHHCKTIYYKLALVGSRTSSDDWQLTPFNADECARFSMLWKHIVQLARGLPTPDEPINGFDRYRGTYVIRARVGGAPNVTFDAKHYEGSGRMGYSFSLGDFAAPGELFYYNPGETQGKSTFYARFNEDRAGVLVTVTGRTKLVAYGDTSRGEPRV